MHEYRSVRNSIWDFERSFQLNRAISFAYFIFNWMTLLFTHTRMTPTNGCNLVNLIKINSSECSELAKYARSVDLYNTICPQSTTNMTSVCGRIRTAFTESNQMCSNYVIMLAVENQQRPKLKSICSWCVNCEVWTMCGFRLALVLESGFSLFNFYVNTV